MSMEIGSAPQGQCYYFDLTPVFGHCDSLRRNPAQAMTMCQHQVRMIAPGARMLPRDSGFYLVMQAHAGSAAEALAGEINLALLTLFFGTDSMNGIARLFRAVPAAEMRAAGVERPPAPALTAPGPDSDPVARLSRCAVKGFENLTSGFLPMLNLQREAPSIYLCGPFGRRDGRIAFGPEMFRRCDSRARPALDVAMLDYSLRFARQIVPNRFAAAICTSVSYETLAWSRGREMYQNALRAADVAANPFLIVKVDDVPLGTTTASLAEIVATVRPHVKRVFVQLPDGEFSRMQTGHIGAAGLCATLPANATPPVIVRFANSLVRAGIGQQALTCVDGLEGTHALPLLRAAGIRFAAAKPEEGSVHLDLPLGWPLGGEGALHDRAA